MDLNALKASSVHVINQTEGWASTVYPNGRNKLSGKKKGSRPWNAYFVCLETMYLLFILLLMSSHRNNRNKLKSCFTYHNLYNPSYVVSMPKG